MSSFLELPGELRNHIYTKLVATNRSASKKLAFLLTCRQVHQEAWRIAWEATTFEINQLHPP
ncbi:uncharacterized protein BDZ99DRAFT_494083, partial [Mytilinidion resinicola]